MIKFCFQYLTLKLLSRSSWHTIRQILFDFILTVQLKIKSVKEEIAVVSRKVYLTQDEVSRKKARCEELDRGIWKRI